MSHDADADCHFAASGIAAIINFPLVNMTVLLYISCTLFVMFSIWYDTYLVES